MEQVGDFKIKKGYSESVIMSQNNDARARRQEILFALNSTRAEQLQEKYGFKIANLPTTFNDTSYVEGASRLTRY